MADDELKRVRSQSNPEGRKGKDLASSSLKPSGPNLPWWVELLFVQIGLPDRWLRKILDGKKNMSIFITNKKDQIVYFSIFIGSIIYVFPIIGTANNHNNCVNQSEQYVAKVRGLDISKDSSTIQAWSNRFCNGGDLND